MEKTIDCMVKQACERFFELKDCYDFKETEKTAQTVYEIYWDNDLFKEVRADLETAIGESEAAHERQGFALGFKEAIKTFGFICE